MIVAKDLREVRVSDLDFERAKKFVETMKSSLSEYSTDIIAVKSANEAIDDADVIITVTSSKNLFLMKQG
ncbi:hypothetical protein GCM10025857_58830 [Alicyclobacillus contaminans]|nr:hypothetical protein GCM10025857_58830 [Alicyclobacillus contaminans]